MHETPLTGEYFVFIFCLGLGWMFEETLRYGYFAKINPTKVYPVDCGLISEVERVSAPCATAAWTGLGSGAAAVRRRSVWHTSVVEAMRLR